MKDAMTAPDAYPRFTAIGLMSGTSVDGIDVALIETDGKNHVKPLGFRSFPYDPAFQNRIRAVLGRPPAANDGDMASLTRDLTDHHAWAVLAFMDMMKLRHDDIDIVGFHGQTIWHDPKAGQTVQIGDGARLADQIGLPVYFDFRTCDVRQGGQGAPLVPLYHRALARDLSKPLAILNIGGVANITWIGGDQDDQILAFDTGPGNAMIDDWMMRRTGRPMDENGAAAAQGQPDAAAIHAFLQHPYFAKQPPKSLDRDAFAALMPPESASIEDGAATLTMMTVQAVAMACQHMPVKPQTLWVTGGGRHNATLCQWLSLVAGLDVRSVDALSWNGDSLEAEAFAYLAVRGVMRAPLSLPGTTGVKYPATGGQLAEPHQNTAQNHCA